MRSIVRLLVLACLAASSSRPQLPPTACGSVSRTTRAPLGRHPPGSDGSGALEQRVDPADDRRLVEGRAGASGAGDGLLRPGVPVRRRRRVRPERTGARPRGADHALGHAVMGERGPETAGDADEHRRFPELRARPRGPILRPVRRLSLRAVLHAIWNESNLATFLVPQFNAAGKIVSPANYAKLARAGIAGIKAGNRSAQVAIGETSSNGRDKHRAGLTDTVAPATFMKGVAAAMKGVRFDAWAHHPYPFPVNQKPSAARPLPERDAQEHAAVREGHGRRVPAARTSRSGSPSTGTRRSPASRRASPRPSRPPTSHRRSHGAQGHARPRCSSGS